MVYTCSIVMSAYTRISAHTFHDIVSRPHALRHQHTRVEIERCSGGVKARGGYYRVNGRGSHRFVSVTNGACTPDSGDYTRFRTVSGKDPSPVLHSQVGGKRRPSPNRDMGPRTTVFRVSPRNESVTRQLKTITPTDRTRFLGP